MKVDYRKLIEICIGRKLLSTEIIHHINGNHNDNRIDNLYIYDSRSGHISYHIIIGTIAMRLINCYNDKCILEYVKKRILPAIKKSNVYELMCENDKGRTC